MSNQGTDDVDGLCDRLWAVDVTSDAESLLSDGTDSDDITSLAAHVQDEEEDDQTCNEDGCGVVGNERGRDI